MPKGKVIFQYRYCWRGKVDRIDIGTYPAISLKDARNSALFYCCKLEQHRNPKVIKRTLRSNSRLTPPGLSPLFVTGKLYIFG
ncbi:MAG: Arm DNA-binding domain-containing protein [Candidatus Phlomobacter fragariae]